MVAVGVDSAQAVLIDIDGWKLLTDKNKKLCRCLAAAACYFLQLRHPENGQLFKEQKGIVPFQGLHPKFRRPSGNVRTYERRSDKMVRNPSVVPGPAASAESLTQMLSPLIGEGDVVPVAREGTPETAESVEDGNGGVPMGASVNADVTETHAALAPDSATPQHQPAPTAQKMMPAVSQQTRYWR